MPSTPPPSPTRVYGFVVMLTAQLLTVFYLFLTFASDALADEVLGENFQQIRQASVTLLVVLGVTIFYAFSSYALLVAANMPAVNDPRWVTDKFAREWNANSENLGDIPKSVWSRQLVKELKEGGGVKMRNREGFLWGDE